MKTYDFIFNLLQEQPELRDSDRKLTWVVWEKLGYVADNKLDYAEFMHANIPNTETIRRTRQKIQEHHPELKASATVQRFRKLKQSSKSTFVYRDEAQVEYRPWEKQYVRYIGTDGKEYTKEA